MVAIANELIVDDIPTPTGKQQGQISTVESILKNEKYKGAALLQKCFTVDSLTDFSFKPWNSTSKYCRVILQCNSKLKSDHKCRTFHFNEETVKARFVDTFNSILADKDSALEDCRLMQTTLTDCKVIDAEIENLLEEIDVVTELAKKLCIAENSQMTQNLEEYTAGYNGLVERYEKVKALVEQLRTTKVDG